MRLKHIISIATTITIGVVIFMNSKGPLEDLQPGINFYYQDKFDEAYDYAKEFVEDNPKSDEGHELFGRIQLKRGYDESARESFEKALELNPENYDAMAGLGRAEGINGNNAKAKELFQKALAGDPKNKMAQQYLIPIYLREGENEKAAEMAQKVFSYGKHPDIDLNGNMAIAFHVTGDSTRREACMKYLREQKYTEVDFLDIYFEGNLEMKDVLQ